MKMSHLYLDVSYFAHEAALIDFRGLTAELVKCVQVTYFYIIQKDPNNTFL